MVVVRSAKLCVSLEFDEPNEILFHFAVFNYARKTEQHFFQNEVVRCAVLEKGILRQFFLLHITVLNQKRTIRQLQNMYLKYSLVEFFEGFRVQRCFVPGQSSVITNCKLSFSY